MYNSKLQSDDTGWKITKKTHNLTLDRHWRDPIDYLINGFSFFDLKTIVSIQEANSLCSFEEISLSTAQWTQKCI